MTTGARLDQQCQWSTGLRDGVLGCAACMTLLVLWTLVDPIAMAQPSNGGPACTVPRSDEERAIAASAWAGLSQIEALVDTLDRIGVDLEKRLRWHDPSGDFARVYRENRRQLADAKKQRAEFAKVVAHWCEKGR